MKSLIFNLLIVFYQFSVQISNQNEESNWKQNTKSIDDDYDVSDLADPMKDNHQYFKEPSPASIWIKMKDMKILTFSRYAFTTGSNHLRQLNCLNVGELCEFGPDYVTCHIQEDLRSVHEFSKYYHCTAILASNIEFERLNITCDKKLDNTDKEEDIENVLVLKGSCFLNYRLKQVDYVLFYLKILIAILCFIVAFILMIYTFSNCRNPERGTRVFLTPFYFTRSTLTRISSSNTLYH